MLALVVLFYLFEGRSNIVRKPLPADVGSEEGISLKDIHLTQQGPDEIMKWTLDAKEVKFSLDRQMVSFNQFYLKLEARDKPSMELTGQKGDFNRKSGEIMLRGALRGYSDRGYEIMTEQVVYRQKLGSLETEHHVRIKGPSFSLEGQGLTLDLKKEVLRINAKVTARIEDAASLL